MSAGRGSPSGGSDSQTPQLLSTKPVRKVAGSHVVSIEKSVREVLGVSEGDQIAFRKVGRYVFIAVVRAFAVAPVSEEEKRLAHAAIGG